MRRLSRGRAATDEEATPATHGASEAVGATPSDAQPQGTAPLSEEATRVTEPAAVEATTATAAGATGGPPAETGGALTDLPAGVDADSLAAVPSSIASRGKLRRRLRYLRHVRELLLRDLGGFYAEAHRSEQGPDAHRRLLDAKAGRLATLDAEVHDLEERLGEPHPEVVIREPGIGGTCPACGELHGSDARFCARCGTPLGGHAAPAPTTPADDGERMTTASLWGRRRTPAEDASAPAATQAGELTQAAGPVEERRA